MNEFDEELTDRLQAEWDALSPERKEEIQQLRAARCRAHVAFDPLWKSGEMTRREAYTWLAKEMKLSQYKCHMERLGVAECDRVVEICTRKAFEDLVQ